MLYVSIVLEALILFLLIYIIRKIQENHNRRELAELKNETELLSRLLQSEISSVRIEILTKPPFKHSHLDKAVALTTSASPTTLTN